MPNVIDSDFIKQHFPTLSEMVYLNNAGTGIPPIETVEAMKRYLHNRIKALGSLEDTLACFKNIRSSLAELLGGDAKQYGFVPNTSEGINAIAHGIDYPKGSNVVICDLEFPANTVPWQNAKRYYGFELRVVQSSNGAASLDSFAKMIDDNTRLVSISQVQFASGFRADLKALAKLVHDRGGMLVSDIIQAAGCIDTDLVELDVDFAACQAPKWLLGPIGAGFVYVKESLIDQITPRYLGWWGVNDLMDFIYREKEPRPDASKFLVGSAAAIAYVGFLESLKLLLKIPGKERENTALDIANYARKRLTEENIEYYDFGPKHNSAIVACAPPKVEELQEKLKKQKIHCSVRNDRLRVSPYFYNTFEDIDKLMDHLG